MASLIKHGRKFWMLLPSNILTPNHNTFDSRHRHRHHKRSWLLAWPWLYAAIKWGSSLIVRRYESPVSEAAGNNNETTLNVYEKILLTLYRSSQHRSTCIEQSWRSHILQYGQSHESCSASLASCDEFALVVALGCGDAKLCRNVVDGYNDGTHHPK